MSANERQIGGSHYKTKYQHWDLVLATGMGYLEGCATKYVSRWRKKGGQADLEKAVHYIDKLIENAELFLPARSERYLLPEMRLRHRDHVHLFTTANSLSWIEWRICALLATWQSRDELLTAREYTRALLIEYFDDPAPVPATDSDKHAERSSEEMYPEESSQ